MAEEIPFPIADWNGNALDNENIYEGGQESEEQMEVSEADLLKRKGKRMTTLKKKAKLRKKCCHHFEKVYLNWYARLKKGMRKTPIHSKKLSCQATELHYYQFLQYCQTTLLGFIFDKLSFSKLLVSSST